MGCIEIHKRLSLIGCLPYLVSPEKPDKPLTLGLSKHILDIISTNKGSFRT